MINEQLLQYIKSQRQAGTSDEEIKENLSAAGWRDEDIAEGFEAVSSPDDTSPQSHQEMRQEATEGRQENKGKQKPDSGRKGESQPDPQSDQYRETVNRNDQQSNQKEAAAAGGAGVSQASAHTDSRQKTRNNTSQTEGGRKRRAANENPQELRTMEEDKNRYGKQTQANKASQKETQNKRSKEQAKTEKQEKNTKQKQTTKSSQKEKPQSSEKPSDQYSPTQAKQKKSRQPDKKQKKHVQPQKKTSKQKSNRSQPGKKPASQKAAKKKQKQRKSKIQQARKQSSSTSISAIILSILALVLIGGGAAYAYLNYFQGPQAETNSQEVMQALADAETFEYRIGVGRQAEGDATTEETVVVEGAVNLTDTGESYYTIRRPSQPGGSPVTGVASEFSEFTNLDPRQQQTISQTLLQPDFFTVREFQTKQQLGATEGSSGFATNRFGVMADPAQLTNAYSTIYNTIYGEGVASPVWSTLQNNLGNFAPQQGQIWVHPTSSAPYQMTLIGNDADGNNLQVNMQFRNHGSEISSAPQTYENQPVVSGFAEAFAADATDDDPEITQSTSTANGGPNGATTDENTTDNNQQAQTRQDQLRINDLQQLRVALQSYADETGSYPANLNELASSQSDILSGLPTDPQTNNPYAYAVNQAQTAYHLGATLGTLSSQQAPDDADYNSTTGSFRSGFDGSGGVCRTNTQSSGSTCYDLRGTVSASAN
jgi:hypothetical protein